MTINERFLSVIKAKGLTIKDAADKIGFTEGYIRKLIIPNQSFGVEPLKTILNSISDLNGNWLITGKGEMFISNKIEKDPPITVERLLSIIESQQRTIENLSKR